MWSKFRWDNMMQIMFGELANSESSALMPVSNKIGALLELNIFWKFVPLIVVYMQIL